MRGLRHLFHGLTSAGVAAAHNADLEAQDMDYQRRSKTLAVAFDRAKKAKATAFQALTQLRAKRIALRRTDPQEQSEEAQTLALQIAVAEEAYNDASDYVKDCRKEIDHNNQLQLKHVPSLIRGAFFCVMPVRCGPPACVSPCHVVPTRSHLLRPPLATILLPPLCAAPTQGMACCV